MSGIDMCRDCVHCEAIREMEKLIEAHRNDIEVCGEDKDKKIDSLEDHLTDIQKKLSDITDLLTAWNNAKGFVRVIEGMAYTVKLFTPVAAVLGAIWYFAHTGKWPG